MTTYFTVSEVKHAANNSERSRFFFSADAMRSFGSRVLDGVHAGHFFVTSETDYGRKNRRYTVRAIDDGGNIDVVGQFRQYATGTAARKAMRRLEWLTMPDSHGQPISLPLNLQCEQVEHEHTPYLVALASEAYNAGRTWALENPAQFWTEDEDARDKARNAAAFAWFRKVHGSPNDYRVNFAYGLAEAFEMGARAPYSG